MLRLAVLLLASALFAADEKPKPPLDLAPPPEPSSTWRENDLTKVDAEDLRAEARHLAYEEGVPEEGAQLQHWAVKADPTRGHYNLACFYSMAGKLDAAFYWLQYCGMEGEGMDPEWAQEDSDLENARQDERWKAVHAYVVACAAWWEKNGEPRTVLTLPTGYAKGTEIAALVGLHGLAAGPEDLSAGPAFQRLADRLGAAVIGVSGTKRGGKRVFAWSEEIDRDMARVKAALDEVKDRVTIRAGRVVVIGFSQGAQLAVELSARDPVTFAGGIAICPGGMKECQLGSIARPSDLLAGRAFILVNGELEQEGNLALGAADEKWLSATGALVLRHVYPGMAHSFPPDELNNFEIWTRFILSTRERAGE